MIQALVPILGAIAQQVAKNLFPNPEDERQRASIERHFAAEVLKQANAIEIAAAEIVKAEAQSGNWLASSWRPITMLTFVALIVARWLGWSAPSLSEAEVLKLWDIVQLGLGGYVIGRSVEKILPSITHAMENRRG